MHIIELQKLLLLNKNRGGIQHRPELCNCGQWKWVPIVQQFIWYCNHNQCYMVWNYDNRVTEFTNIVY